MSSEVNIIHYSYTSILPFITTPINFYSNHITSFSIVRWAWGYTLVIHMRVLSRIMMTLSVTPLEVSYNFIF